MTTGRNDPCWCGSGKKWKKCHFPAQAPDTASQALREQYRRQYGILLKTPEQIVGIRKACQIAALLLKKIAAAAQIGVTTEALNAYAEELHRQAGVIAAPLGYGTPPFPKSICTSLNEVICHGIPDSTPLKDGDILNIDVSVIWNGYYGDCSQMVLLGTPSAERRLVSDVAYQALWKAIHILKPGVLICDLGEEIEAYATAHGCSVVDQFVGHGTGLAFHEPPQIPHHRNSIQIPLVAGMTFTIEPMINAGRREAVIDPSNQWVARTIDGRASGQWEHTVLITETGYEVLTEETGSLA